MGRRPCCDGVGLKKGAWTAVEDRKLINFIQSNEQCCWRNVPKHAGLLRCGKSCRLRWTNYLRPDLKRGLLSDYEEKLVIDLHSQLGNRWSQIASHMPGRTDNEIKNLWNTHIKKKLSKMGIDPVTHKPLAPDHNKDKQKEGILSLESTINDDDQSQQAQEETTPNIHDQIGEDQEKDRVLLFEEPTITSDLTTKEVMETETNNCFSIDEVPLIEAHEFVAPVPNQPTSTEIPMSTVDSVLEDLKYLPIFEDWPTENDGNIYDENTSFPNDYDITDWESLINDIDNIIGHQIFGPPPSPSPTITIGV